MKVIFAILIPIFGLMGQSKVEQATKLFNEKKFPEASRIFQSMKEGDQGLADAQYYLGRIAYNDKKWDESVEYFEKAIEINNKVADYHFWLGNAMGSEAQEANVIKQGFLAPKIKAEFEKTAQLDPKHTGAYHGLISFYSQAPGIMGGSFEKAHECADKIKKLNLAEGCRAKAGIYVRQNNFVEAEKEWKSAVRADESYFPALITFYTNQKKYALAFTALDEALKKNSESMSLAYQYGRTSAISGEKLDLGEVHLKKYLVYKPKENEPSHAGAHMRLAQIMEKKGNKTEAKKLFQTAVQLDPNLKEAKEGLARVK